MRALALVFVLAPACSFESEVLTVPVDGARAMVIIYASSGGVERAQAIEPDARASAYTIPRPRHDPTDIYVLRYGCTLAELEMTAGPLETGPGRGLPLTSSISALHVSGPASAWTPATELPPAVANTELALPPLPSPCVSFTRTEVLLPETTLVHVGDSLIQPTFALALDEDSALIALSDGRFFRASRSLGAALELTGITTSTPALAGFRANDGDIYLLGPGGWMSHGDLARNFGPPAGDRSARHLRLRSATGSTFARLDGAPPGSPMEMFVLTDAGAVEYFDPLQPTHTGTGTWIVPALRAPGAPGIERGEGDLAWIGPREAIAVGLAPGMIEVYSPDHAVRREPLPVAPVDPYQAISARLIPGIGALIGTKQGTLHRWTGEGLESFAALELKAVRAIVPLDRGVLAGGDDGRFAQVYPGRREACAVEVLEERARTVSIAVPLGSGYLLLTLNEWGDGVFAIFLGRTAPVAEISSCLAGEFGGSR